MDDSSGVLVGGEMFSNAVVQNWNNLRSDWSTSVLDQTHRLILSGIYEWAFWNRRRGGLMGLLLSGWETGVIVSIFTGGPLAIYTATDNSNSMGGRQRPNWTGRNASLRDPTPQRWFDTSQFSQPPAYTFGNTPRTLNGVRSDGGRNVDLGLNKKFVVNERCTMEFRAEVFNLFNRPQYAPPNTLQGSRGFGVVSAMQNQPRIVQFGLKLIH